MSVETITSVKNPLVASLRALKTAKARRETGLFLVEGETMLNEALSSGLVPRALLAETETPLAARFPEARLVTRGVLEAVCDTKTPQGMCAAFELPPPCALSDAPQTLVALDGVQDPGNVGTIWRTADAAGFGGLLLGANCADPYSPKVQRAAMGSGFRLPAIPAEPLCDVLAALRARGWMVSPRRSTAQTFTKGSKWGSASSSSSAARPTESQTLCARRPTRWSNSPCAAAPNRSTRRWRRAL